MAKMPEGFESQDLYIASRSVLLDALEALADQMDALILVGAQAVYLRSGSANLPVAVYTSDGDLSVDRNRLNDMPRLEQAMRDADFRLGSGSDRRQPGQWFKTVQIDGEDAEIAVDLLIAGTFSGASAGRRSANLSPHDRMAVRRVDGLELALVDNDFIRIESLEPEIDQRSIRMRVAGIAALLTAKAYKIHDRESDPRPERAADKDAGDVIRMMRTSELREVSATFVGLLNHPDTRISQTAKNGLTFLKDQFGRVRGSGIIMAERALAGALPADTIRGLAMAYARELPDSTDSH